MLLNSKNIVKMDVSNLQTCELCPEKIFLSPMELDHHKSTHQAENESIRNITSIKLAQLKKTKKNLTAKLRAVKEEADLMCKWNVQDEKVVELLEKEILSLKQQIDGKDADIRLLSDNQEKSATNDLAHEFKKLLDTEYEELICGTLKRDQPQTSASAPNLSMVAGPSKEHSSQRCTCTTAAVDIEKFSKEVSQLKDKLSESTALVQEMTHKNQEVEGDLALAVEALESSNTTNRHMMQDKEKIEAKLRANEKKIKEQNELIQEHEKRSPSVEIQEKIALLHEQLTATDEELFNLMECVEEKENDLAHAHRKQKLMENENVILTQLIDELREEQNEKCSEWEKEMADLLSKQRSLEKENQSLLCKLTDYEIANKDQTVKIDQLTSYVKQLENQKAQDKEQIALLSAERDEFKQQLVVLQQTHGKCIIEKQELKALCEKSVEDMRLKMQKYLDEGKETSYELQANLEEQLKELRRKHRVELSKRDGERLNLQNTIEDLEKEINIAKFQPKVDIGKSKRLEKAIDEANLQLSKKAELENTIEELRHELRSTQRSLDVANSRKDSLRKEVSELKELLDTEIGKTNDFRRQRDLAEKKFNNRQEQLARAEEDVASIKTQLVGLKKQLTLKDSDHKMEIERLMVRINDLQIENDYAQEGINENQKPESDAAKITSENEKLSLQILNKNESEKNFIDEIKCLTKKVQELEAVSTGKEKLMSENEALCAEISNMKELEKSRVEEIRSLTNKINDSEECLQSAPSKEKLRHLEEKLANALKLQKEAVLQADMITKQNNASKDKLATSLDEIEYLKEKYMHAEKTVKDTELLLEKTQKQLEVKNTKLQKQDREISHFLDQRSELKSKINNMVKNSEKHKMAKELAEQKLKEEKIRSTELREIVNELRDAEQCDHKATEALLLEERRKRSDLEEIIGQMKLKDDQTQKELASEKQNTFKLEQIIIQMKDEMEALRKTNQTSNADGMSYRTDEAVEQQAPLSSAEDNTSGKQGPLVVNDNLVDRVSSCSSEEEEITPTASQISLSGESSEQDNHESIIDNDEQLEEPHEVSQNSDCLSDDDDDDGTIGTALDRKETVVFHVSPSIPSNNDGDKDDEHDIEIPKHQWDEKIINGKEQSLDEEIGDSACEPVKITPEKQSLDVAVIQNPASLPDLVLNNSVNSSDSDVSLKADSSSSESLPSSGSNSSESIKTISNSKGTKKKNKKGKKVTNKHMPVHFSSKPSPGASQKGASQKGEDHSNHKMFDDKLNNKRTPKSDGNRKLKSSKPGVKAQPIVNQGANVRRLSAVFSKETIAPVATNQCFPKPTRISSIKEKFENLSC
ncbi:myosin heavy chain, cardiac muscle isoform-like [Clytia hemisphaerica]|uniref:myosin heavy chain, cardiac muscle isoform-like n=1 Tax=Clytia hemisphaerica TaxID=252671 RepID=UPI0034D428BB